MNKLCGYVRSEELQDTSGEEKSESQRASTGTKCMSIILLALTLLYAPLQIVEARCGGGGHGGGHCGGGGHVHCGGGGHSGGHGSGRWGRGGGGGGGSYDEPYEHPYYAGYDAVVGLRNYYDNKIAAAANDLPGDQAKLNEQTQKYQSFAARVQDYEVAVAKQIADYRHSAENVEQQLSRTHDPKQAASLRKWLDREMELEEQASRNIQNEEAWVRHEHMLLDNAAYNVSEDQEQIADYNRLKSQMRH